MRAALKTALPDFADFLLKFQFQEGRRPGCKTRCKACPLRRIFANVNSENLPKLSKERLQYFCNALELKVSGEKKELGKCKQFFDSRKALESKIVSFQLNSILPRFRLHLQNVEDHVADRNRKYH